MPDMSNIPSVRTVLHFFKNRPALADTTSVAGMIMYAWLLWSLAHTQISVLDEGLYLYKGWLFATGRYAPFQDYGAWTNQMPLSFLIPGWVEMIFGAGLRTGRMMAIVLGMLALLGLWLTGRRLGGRWAAAGCVALVVLNPAAARMVTMAASQGLVACILAWTLYLSLGADRKGWQVFCGGLLAGMAVMVRINLLPLLPLLALYLLWARGLNTALVGLGGMLISFGGVHLAYWPNILKLWAKWLPFPFLQPWFSPKAIPNWNPDNPLGFRVASFFLAFRYHFAALAGALAAWIFWPKTGRISAEKQKISIFLSVLLLSFFLLHAWAALGNEYCVFCFPTYTTFYAGVGLLLVVVTVGDWNFSPPAWRKWSSAIGFLVMLAGMAYSAESAAGQMLGEYFYKRLLATPLPGLHGAQIWQVLANKFHLDYGIIYDGFHTWLPVIAAVGLGLVVFVGLKIFLVNQKSTVSWSVGIIGILLLCSTFAPVPVLAGDYRSYDCAGDVIQAYETTGAILAKTIPSGSKVFWAGYSPVTLLYLPGAQIYPAQLNGIYSYRISEDDNAMVKYGWWNEHLAQKWLGEADFVLAEQKNLGKDDWLGAGGRLDNFEQVAQSAPLSCREDAATFVYRRK